MDGQEVFGSHSAALIRVLASPVISRRGQSTSSPEARGLRGCRRHSAWPRVADTVLDASVPLALWDQQQPICFGCLGPGFIVEEGEGQAANRKRGKRVHELARDAL